MREMTAVETAWLAGLFEGEGTLGPTRTGWGISIVMTDADIVQRCQTVSGAGHFRCEPRSEANRKDCYRWRTMRRDEIAAIVRAIRPHLGQRRGARADEFLAWYEQGERVGWPRPTWASDHGQGINGAGCERHRGEGRYKSGACRGCRREINARSRAKRAS